MKVSYKAIFSRARFMQVSRYQSQDAVNIEMEQVVAQVERGKQDP